MQITSLAWTVLGVLGLVPHLAGVSVFVPCAHGAEGPRAGTHPCGYGYKKTRLMMSVLGERRECARYLRRLFRTSPHLAGIMNESYFVGGIEMRTIARYAG